MCVQLLSCPQLTSTAPFAADRSFQVILSIAAAQTFDDHVYRSRFSRDPSVVIRTQFCYHHLQEPVKKGNVCSQQGTLCLETHSKQELHSRIQIS